MKRNLTNKWLVITGASSGLGKALAYECARRGGNLILIARTVDKLLALKTKIKSQFAVAIKIFPLDITDFPKSAEIVKNILTRFDVDVLINCAGVGLFELAASTPLSAVKRMFDTNVIGLIYFTQLFIPHFTSKGTGHIINIASQAGKLATPKSSVYAASKSAVLGFTNALRLELASKNIFVTAINTGPVATDFFRLADLSGHYLKNVGNLVLKPEAVAHKTASIIGKKRREVNMPFLMNMATKAYQMSPRAVEFLGKKAFLKK